MSDKGYDVGYRRPPKKSRFKAGQSGNPRGRPKGNRSIDTELSEELGQKITVTEDGRRLRITKAKALVKRLVSKALQGDIRAAQILLNIQAKAPPSPPGEVRDLSTSDQEILENYLKSQIEAMSEREPDPAVNEPAHSSPEETHDAK